MQLEPEREATDDCKDLGGLIFERRKVDMSLHDDIMNLRCDVPKDANVNQALSFKYGHKQAQHAAAELANSADSELERLRARVAELEAQQDPTTDDISAQDWKGMDGACAFSLIDRHADDWTHAGRLMNAWRLANPPTTDEQQVA